MNDLTQATHQPSEQDIRDRAYQLWEEAGRPEGEPDQFWNRAREALTKSSGEDLVEKAGGHYPPPAGDSQNFA